MRFKGNPVPRDLKILSGRVDGEYGVGERGDWFITFNDPSLKVEYRSAVPGAVECLFFPLQGKVTMA